MLPCFGRSRTGYIIGLTVKDNDKRGSIVTDIKRKGRLAHTQNGNKTNTVGEVVGAGASSGMARWLWENHVDQGQLAVFFLTHSICGGTPSTTRTRRHYSLKLLLEGL